MTDTFWSGKRVLVTGHTGFIGSWLCLWLHRLGAEVSGAALDPPSQPNLFEVARVASLISDARCDVRDATSVAKVVKASRPDVVFHLAAQALVRESYRTPIETYATNVMGTVHVLDALRHHPGVEAVVVVTSDKCYANDESGRPLREPDALGGVDPYSSSKAGAELVAASYRDSFLRSSGVPVATVRAGNVIGGGDWAADRLLPDIVRAFACGQPVRIRHPTATRPWQHVFDPIAGCIALAEALATHGDEYAEPWNFGPDARESRPVSHVVAIATESWANGGSFEIDNGKHVHEAHQLRLDASKAQTRLGWRPCWDVDRAVRESLNWYRAHHEGQDMLRYSQAQISEFSGAGRHD